MVHLQLSEVPNLIYDCLLKSAPFSKVKECAWALSLPGELLVKTGIVLKYLLLLLRCSLVQVSREEPPNVDI